MAIERLDTGERISRAVISDNLIFLAGQASPEPAGDAVGQSAAVLKKIDELLARAGSSKEKILSVQVHLADIKSFDDMNKAWVAWVPKGAQPARTVVEARLPRPEFLVEMTVVATK